MEGLAGVFQVMTRYRPEPHNVPQLRGRRAGGVSAGGELSVTRKALNVLRGTRSSGGNAFLAVTTSIPCKPLDWL
jgi:hypothetical protein